MARHPKYPKPEGQMGLEEIGSMNRAPKRRGKPPKLSTAKWHKLLEDVEELNERRAWDAFEPKHMVGLYARAHMMVYKVLPEEVRNDFSLAVRAAKKMLKDEFDEEPEPMVDFLEWYWVRENKRMKTRKEDDSWRPGWRYQFSTRLMTDYRAYRARKGGRIR